MTQSKATWLCVFTMITGFALCALLTCNKEKQDLPVIPIAQQKHTADSIDAHYETKNAPVEKKVTLLKKEKISADKTIIELNAAAADKKEALLAVSENIGTDSLSQAVGEYIQAQDTLVTSQQTQITRLDSIVTLQDTIVANDRSHIADMKTLFQTSLDQQQILVDKNLLMGKELKREKRKSALLKIGIVLVSGTAATLLIMK